VRNKVENVKYVAIVQMYDLAVLYGNLFTHSKKHIDIVCLTCRVLMTMQYYTIKVWSLERLLYCQPSMLEQEWKLKERPQERQKDRQRLKGHESSVSLHQAYWSLMGICSQWETPAAFPTQSTWAQWAPGSRKCTRAHAHTNTRHIPA